MTFSLQENTEFIESDGKIRISPLSRPKRSKTKKTEIHLFAEKLRIPEFNNKISRPRLNELLAKSSVQFGATLICGRSGTGKSALASDFAGQYKNVAWYSVESADIDWNTFSNYLSAAVLKNSNKHTYIIGNNIDSVSCQEKIAKYFALLFRKIEEKYNQERLLIVLDDVHHVFDADWFTDFFHQLLSSFLPSVHLLLLSRSKPASPLWRLRSKQVLNVIDEKLLSLNVEETEQLFKAHGLSIETAKKAHRDSFGRISKLMLSVETPALG